MAATFANFDQRNNSIVVPDDLAKYLHSKTSPRRTLRFSSRSTPAIRARVGLACSNYVTASQDHLPQSLRSTYKGNFQATGSFCLSSVQRHQDGHTRRLRHLHLDQPGSLSFNNSGNPTSSLHSLLQLRHAGPNTPLIQFPNRAPSAVPCRYGGGASTRELIRISAIPSPNQWNLTVERSSPPARRCV